MRGQVGYQESSERSSPRKGMEVRIYPSSQGGSYRMAALDVNGFVQVHRVR